MQKVYNKFKYKVLPIVGLGVFIGISASFSIAAAQKIWASVNSGVGSSSNRTDVLAAKNVNNEDTELTESENDIDDTKKNIVLTQAADVELVNVGNEDHRESVNDNQSSNKVVNQNTQNSSNKTQTQTQSVQNNSTTSGQTFTLAQLALHNKSGDCFVAYKGTVYDISNTSAWAGCKHHGAVGGTDITSIFPHSTTYFNSLPVVGKLVSSANNTNQNQNTQANTQSQNSVSNVNIREQEDREDESDFENQEND